MAGGALGGVIGAAFRLIPSYHEGWLKTPFYDFDPVSQTVSVVGFTALCVYQWWWAVRKEKTV